MFCSLFCYPSRPSLRHRLDTSGTLFNSSNTNAIPSQVRYGQIKRKLGLDNWTSAKAKDDDADDDGPKTPSKSGRGKKAAATPSTGGTGAGVKKRASTSKRSTVAASGGSRARKAKSQAIVKLEEQNQDDDEEDDDEDILPETPTKKGGSANRGHSSKNRYMVNIDYSNFPPVLPEMVLDRQAIFVNTNGTWTPSPVSADAHAQWLAGLPAHIQTQFYTQVAASGKNGAFTHGNFINDEGDNEEAAARAQLLGEQFGGAATGQVGGTLPNAGMNMNMNMPVGVNMGMGYAGAAANPGGHNGAKAGKIDLHSIPMHPSYMEQMDREMREQEARDHATLFGGHDAF